jgi:hypothetical protein
MVWDRYFNIERLVMGPLSGNEELILLVRISSRISNGHTSAAHLVVFIVHYRYAFISLHVDDLPTQSSYHNTVQAGVVTQSGPSYPPSPVPTSRPAWYSRRQRSESRRHPALLRCPRGHHRGHGSDFHVTDHLRNQALPVSQTPNLVN